MVRLVLHKTLHSIVVLISGGGSNLTAIIKNANKIGVEIVAVISNTADAFGLEIAKKSNIKTAIIISKNTQRLEFDLELAKIIDNYNPKLIILAGFMRILSQDFTDKFAGKLLNIHPSLLPKFKGLNTHSRAIAAGEKFAGATVHLVTNELDGGKIIKQVRVAIDKNDNAETLAKKVLKQEHILYSQAIQEFLANDEL